jgi:hypothetical protein
MLLEHAQTFGHASPPRSDPPQVLSKTDRPLDLLETEGEVRPLALEIPEQGVGGHLGVAPIARPALGGRDERPADAAAARPGDDVPALDVRHRHRAAAVGEGSQRQLDHAERVAGCILAQEHGRKQTLAPKVGLGLAHQIAFGLDGPQRDSQPAPRRKIARPDRPHSHGAGLERELPAPTAPQ